MIKTQVCNIPKEDKRPLTESEITKLAEMCFVDYPLPPDLRSDLQKSVHDEITRQCKKVQLYPSKIPECMKLIAKQYHQAVIHPGEAVGEQAAQSMGAPTTQMALNAFHSAGKITRMTTGGLPRMIELTHCSKDKDIKNPSCTIYFNKDYESIDEIPMDQILETCISNLVCKYEIHEYEPTKVPWWYKFFNFFGKPETFDWFIRLYLDKDQLYQRQILPKQISDIIMQKIMPTSCVYSPTQQAIIDVYVDTSMISIPDEINTQLLSVTMVTNKLLRDYVLPQILDIYIKGVKDIKTVYPLKNLEGKYFVETDGSNLKGVLELPFVCNEKTICNRPMEIYDLFGILGLEAYYRREFANIFEQSASYVNPSWIDLVVHSICHTGKPVPANRFGHMKKQEVSTFTKATFEEMTTHLVRAAVFGEHDPLNSIAGRVVTGKRCKLGTGMIDVAVDPDMIENLEYLPPLEGPQRIQVKVPPVIPDRINDRFEEDEASDDGSAASDASSVAESFDDDFDFDDEPDDDDFVDF